MGRCLKLFHRRYIPHFSKRGIRINRSVPRPIDPKLNQLHTILYKTKTIRGQFAYCNTDEEFLKVFKKLFKNLVIFADDRGYLLNSLYLINCKISKFFEAIHKSGIYVKTVQFRNFATSESTFLCKLLKNLYKEEREKHIALFDNDSIFISDSFFFGLIENCNRKSMDGWSQMITRLFEAFREFPSTFERVILETHGPRDLMFAVLWRFQPQRLVMHYSPDIHADVIPQMFVPKYEKESGNNLEKIPNYYKYILEKTSVREVFVHSDDDLYPRNETDSTCIKEGRRFTLRYTPWQSYSISEGFSCLFEYDYYGRPIAEINRIEKNADRNSFVFSEIPKIAEKCGIHHEPLPEFEFIEDLLEEKLSRKQLFSSSNSPSSIENKLEDSDDDDEIEDGEIHDSEHEDWDLDDINFEDGEIRDSEHDDEDVEEDGINNKEIGEKTSENQKEHNEEHLEEEDFEGIPPIQPANFEIFKYYHSFLRQNGVDFIEILKAEIKKLQEVVQNGSENNLITTSTCKNEKNEDNQGKENQQKTSENSEVMTNNRLYLHHLESLQLYLEKYLHGKNL